MPNVNEYMLKQADAEAIYQKKLNAGTGINIDPITDTISATGSGGSTVTYTPNITTGMILGVLGINGSSNPIKSPSLIAGQNISITQDPTTGALTFSSANATYNDMIGADGTNPGTHGLAPAPAATDNTKFLKGDGTWGDPVTPNPSAAATATLSKLSINNTVYNLAGGTTTYFGTTDPSNSVGNNGDLYFKYTSTPTTVEKEITLPTIPYGQNTYIEINDFSSYTDFTFTYTDVYGASLKKTVSISDIPESNDPLNGNRYEVYTFNSWLYLFVGKDSNGLWVVRGENCSFTKLVGTYAGIQIDIIKAYVKINDEWIEQSSGSGGGASVVELTQAQYNALTPTEKTNGSIYMTHDGGYNFISYDNGKIIVRVNTSTGETIWYFNGYTKESADIDVPTELVPYIPTQTYSGSVLMCWAWTDDTSTTRNGAIGFLYPGTTSVKLRSWNDDYSVLYGGTFWGTLIIDGAQEQQSNYTSPTEGLSLLPNRIYYNDTLYADLGDSSGGEIDTGKIVLFENGQWQNQNIMEITLYLGTIINNKLHCQGMHCGIVVSDVSGMTWSGSYKLIIEVESSNGFSFQIGQCTPTSDLDGIIRAGTNRITYTNDSITDSEHYILKANAIDATRGIFLGGYYLDSSIDYYITKISLEYNNEKEYT